MKVQSGFYTNIKVPAFKKRKDKQPQPQLFINKSKDDVISMEYSKPVTLKKALYDIISSPAINEGVVGEKDTIRLFLNDLSVDKKILNKKVVGLAGYGSSAAVFETADGKILKMTYGNHFPLNRPHEIFDVPVYASGRHGKTHFYVEEKLYQHCMPQYFVDTVRDMIVGAGYRPNDFFADDTHQIGLSKNGRLYLLDAECARYRSLLHAVVDKAKRFVLKRI